MSARRFPWSLYIWTLVAIAIFAVSPAIVAIMAGLIQSGAGCANTGPCIIAGSNWNPGLNNAQILIWLIVITWPVAGLIFTVWLLVLLVHIWQRGKQAGAA